jgi:hypothetical protein
LVDVALASFKWLQSTWESHEQLCLQVAQLDSYAGEIRVEKNRLQTETANMRQSMTVLEEAQGMVSDGTDAIHYAVVEMGGYVRMTELNPEQRRHMYTQERGNLVAANVISNGICRQSGSRTVRGYSVGRIQMSEQRR